MEKFAAQVPASARPGQIARFNALGQFQRMEDRVSNGLGILFQVQRDGSLRRYFF